MAKQTGILKLKGQIGGLSFYHHRQYGWIARQSNPVDAARIRKDPAFARVRENGSEFGMASSAGKLMRDGLRGFLEEIGTDFLDNRTMKLMMGIKNEDQVSERGKRNVGASLAAKPEQLEGFELHFRETLFRFVGQHPVVDKVAGTVSLKDFVPFHAPKFATHVALTVFRGRLDFEMGERDFVFSEEMVYPLDEVERDVVLSVARPEGESGMEIWGMKVVYMQEVNGELHSLKVGAGKLLDSELIICDAFGGTNGIITNDLITNYEILEDGLIDCVAACGGTDELITNLTITDETITNYDELVDDDGLGGVLPHEGTKGNEFLKTLFLIAGLCISYSAYAQNGVREFDIGDWVVPLEDTVIDVDGNVYHTQRIGTQIWMLENLRVTHFNNGTPIPMVKDDKAWTKTSGPAYCKIIETHYTGRGMTYQPTEHLAYNFYVVSDSARVCPSGWHVPVPAEWKVLENYMDTVNRAHSLDLVVYTPGDTVQTVIPSRYFEYYNIGFTSMLYGYRAGHDGSFSDYSSWGYWWSTDATQVATAWYGIWDRGFGVDDIHLEGQNGNKRCGYAVKCLRNE